MTIDARLYLTNLDIPIERRCDNLAQLKIFIDNIGTHRISHIKIIDPNNEIIEGELRHFCHKVPIYVVHEPAKGPQVFHI